MNREKRQRSSRASVGLSERRGRGIDKAAIDVLADTETHGELGRLVKGPSLRSLVHDGYEVITF